MFNAMKEVPKKISYFLVKVFRLLTTKRDESWFLTCQFVITKFTFFVHNSIVNFIFDKPEPIYKFNISQELLTKLNDWVLNANEINDLWSKESYGLILDQKISSENIKKLKKEKIFFDTSTEITIFKTNIDKEQIHPGHPKGRHYRSILKSYMS